MDNQEESTTKMLKFSKLVKLLEEEKYPHLLRWSNRDKGHFEIGFFNKNNHKWNPSYLDVFKELEGDGFERLKRKYPLKYESKCKENFRALTRKWIKEGKLEKIDEKRDETGMEYIEFRVFQPDRIPELMNLKRKRKSPDSASNSSKVKKRKRNSESPSHYLCLSVQSGDSGYTSSESKDDFCNSPQNRPMKISQISNEIKKYQVVLSRCSKSTQHSMASTSQDDQSRKNEEPTIQHYTLLPSYEGAKADTLNASLQHWNASTSPYDQSRKNEEPTIQNYTLLPSYEGAKADTLNASLLHWNASTSPYYQSRKNEIPVAYLSNDITNPSVPDNCVSDFGWLDDLFEDEEFLEYVRKFRLVEK